MRQSVPSSAKAALGTIGALLISLLAGEAALRLVRYPSPIASGWGWDQSPRRNLAASDDTGHNELGLRGVTFSYDTDDIVVLLLGDSQVEAATSSRNMMPERLLEAHLAKQYLPRSIKVFSLASSGWGHDQQLLALERYFRAHRADLVLQWITPGNDFWENAFPDRSVTAEAGHIKPTFWFDGHELQGPFFTGAVHLSNVRLWDLVLRARLTFMQRTFQQAILDQWLTQLPPDDRQQTPEQTLTCARYPTIDQNELLKELFTLSATRGVVVRTIEDVEHSRSHFSPYIEPRSAKDRYLVDITRALVARIQHVAQAHGAAFRVFYPIRPDFDDLGKKGLRCIETTTGKQFVARWDMLALVQSIVEEDALIAVSVPGGEELSVDPTDRHFSDKGNDRAMHILAEEVFHHKLVHPISARVSARAERRKEE